MTKDKRNYRKRVYESYRSVTLGRKRGNASESLRKEVEQYTRRWRKFLPRGERLSAIDLGCGGGEYLLFLKQQGFIDLTGVDISSEQAQLARERGLENLIEADVVTTLSKIDQSFDLIVTLNLLEHLTRDELLVLLDLIFARLRPGGLLFAVVPNARGLFGAKVRWADITHELSFTPESISQVLSVTGLELVAIKEHGPVSHGVISGFRWLFWQIVRLFTLAAIFAETGNYWDRCFTQDMMIVARRPSMISDEPEKQET